jgi:hypothetical protein
MPRPFRLGFLTHVRGSDNPKRVYRETLELFTAADRVLPFATDLILQFDPVFPSLDHTLRMLEQIAAQVAPALGWQANQEIGELEIRD